MHTVTAPELKEMMEQAQPVLLDVRTLDEIHTCMIEGSVHIPMNDIVERHHELNPNETYVCICHHGMRSASVAQFLLERGFTNVINLQGGIEAWAAQVDPTMARY